MRVCRKRPRRQIQEIQRETCQMKNRFRRTRLAAAVSGAALMIVAAPSFGAAFALQENSGSGLGNAFAGGAAVAEDASTVWANPAGMSRIPTAHVCAALHL